MSEGKERGRRYRIQIKVGDTTVRIKGDPKGKDVRRSRGLRMENEINGKVVIFGVFSFCFPLMKYR